MLGLDYTEKFARDTVIDLPADSSMRVFFLTDPTGVSGAYFVDLRLTAADGKPISNNFYWLSTRMDVLSISGFILHKEENVNLSENRAAFAELQRG